MSPEDTASFSEENRPLAGSILIAHPTLGGGIFRRSVILLPAHDENGSMGIILNRPLHKRVADVSSELAAGPLSDVPVYRGGPVAEDKLLLCAWRMHPGGMGFQMMFGVDPETAGELRNQQGMELRAYYGYSGWDAGQLEGELKENAWVVTPLEPSVLGVESGDEFDDDALWRRTLVRLDPEWRLSVDEPDDLERN